MLKTTVRALTVALLLAGGTLPIRAAEPIFIDFESFPGADGILGTADDLPAPSCPTNICFPLSDEYAGLGLTFTFGALAQFGLFPGTAETNHFVTGSYLDVTLDRDAYFASIESFSAWRAVLWVFDESDVLITTRKLAPGFGTLSLSTHRPFRRFTVRSEGCAPMDSQCNPILNLDNLRLQLGPPEPPEGEWLLSPEVPGFRFKVRIRAGAAVIDVRQEADCIPEALCVSGAVPGRTEVLLRVVGPKPNGYLWPTLARFTISEVEVWIEKLTSGELKFYLLRGLGPGQDELPGLVDRSGFQP